MKIRAPKSPEFSLEAEIVSLAEKPVKTKRKLSTPSGKASSTNAFPIKGQIMPISKNLHLVHKINFFKYKTEDGSATSLTERS